MTMQIQQGDVNIEATTIPDGVKKRDGNVIAEGEATGHAHRVKGDAELFELGDRLFISVMSGYASVVHEEHGTVTLPEGEYEASIVYEMDHFAEEVRRVAD